MSTLENYFRPFRENIIGFDSHFESPYGKQPVIYADWIASGRLYKPIEDKLINEIGPLVGNTHSETSETGTSMTHAYKLAHQIIKEHVNAEEKDVLITTGTGMTGAINKFQRILGLKIPEQIRKLCKMGNSDKKLVTEIAEEDRPVVFLTHMEHHSNHTSWLETIADVVVLEPCENMLVNPDALREEIKKYANRKFKIGSFSACSNVTGIKAPYYELSRIMHEHGGFSFIDFAASAPYEKIDMHPADPMERLDAIFFSPHKFLGGPGSTGVLIFNSELYHNQSPDHPGGGTVNWTDRWGGFSYVNNIEIREDGGTPGFMQAYRIALSIRLKEQMGEKNIHDREQELLKLAFPRLRKIPNLYILQDNVEDRLGVLSFYVLGVHHNLITKLLNDRFGVQVRGGCSCAGTYGHFLLHVDQPTSQRITATIEQGDLSLKPGWVRMSIHPTMTDAELLYVVDSIAEVIKHHKEWSADYTYSKHTGEFYHNTHREKNMSDFEKWFVL